MSECYVVVALVQEVHDDALLGPVYHWIRGVYAHSPWLRLSHHVKRVVEDAWS